MVVNTSPCGESRAGGQAVRRVECVQTGQLRHGVEPVGVRVTGSGFGAARWLTGADEQDVWC